MKPSRKDHLSARALAARALAPVLSARESLSDTLPMALSQVTPVLPPEGRFTFTRSADDRVTYLIAEGWPGKQVRTKAFRPAPGSRVTMLGWPDALPWEQLGAVCVIATPSEMVDEENHPCVQAFVFRIEAPAR